MSPRPYRLGQRQILTEQARARILAAARELLMESSGFSSFSMEAVARQADVAIVLGALEEVCPLGLAPSTSTTPTNT